MFSDPKEILDSIANNQPRWNMVNKIEDIQKRAIYKAGKMQIVVQFDGEGVPQWPKYIRVPVELRGNGRRVATFRLH